TDNDERSVLGPEKSVAGPEDSGPSPDRRAVLDERRRSRRLRRLYAFGGLAVLVAFLAATVVVVDMVR
ncbi:MAG TPA: hypothetical protein VMD28_02845, partial [Acidimicrobiales bacterium]|nr:hypothetical protein [Acidimicrobiales bacterium]